LLQCFLNTTSLRYGDNDSFAIHPLNLARRSSHTLNPISSKNLFGLCDGSSGPSSAKSDMTYRQLFFRPTCLSTSRIWDSIPLLWYLGVAARSIISMTFMVSPLLVRIS